MEEIGNRQDLALEKPAALVTRTLDVFDKHQAESYNRADREVQTLRDELEFTGADNQALAPLGEIRARAAGALKSIESIRKAQVTPLRKTIERLNGLWKNLTLKFEEVDAEAERRQQAILQSMQEERARAQAAADEKALALQQEQQAAIERAEEATTVNERNEALAEANEASKALVETRLDAPRAVPTKVQTEGGTSYVRKQWTYQILEGKEGEVPREYCSPDAKKIRAAISAGVRNIPGLSIYEEESMPFRSRG